MSNPPITITMQIHARLLQEGHTVSDFRSMEVVIVPPYMGEDGSPILGEWRGSVDDAFAYSLDWTSLACIELPNGSLAEIRLVRMSGGTLDFVGVGNPPFSYLDNVGPITETWATA